MEVIIYALTGRPTTSEYAAVPRTGSGDPARYYSDDYVPCIAFGDRPGGRRLLRDLKQLGDSSSVVTLHTTASDLGFTPDAVSRAAGLIHQTGCRYVISIPEIGIDVREDSGDLTRLLLGISPLCSELQRTHSSMLENYTLHNRPRGRPNFGYIWTKNKYGRWTMRKHPQQHRVRRMILQLNGRGYSGRQIREFLQKHGVSPVPALNTIYNIVKEPQ